MLDNCVIRIGIPITAGKAILLDRLLLQFMDAYDYSESTSSKRLFSSLIRSIGNFVMAEIMSAKSPC